MSEPDERSIYFTTPIYYVNDRPHIGHCFTTIVADVAARFARLVRGAPTPAAPSREAAPRDVFLLTGTDEHADKVVTSAKEHGTTPQAWSDQNAAEYERAFRLLDVSNDDFIRTTEARHKEKVPGYVRRMVRSGDVYQGEYTGWYDAGQEEYVTETAAKESDYKSPVNGKPLVRRTEPCFFFKLSKYAEPLKRHMEAHPEFVQPDARRSEVLGRLKLGLNDVPISRPVTDDPATQWGIRMPDQPGHRVYVWIDALFNYYTAVDTPARRHLWPTKGRAADVVQLLGKDILWFHAVIWPALLLAIDVELPRTIYAHGWWLSEGQKMSKSLGNFIAIEQLEAYANRYSLDALRWFLISQGPTGANDANFAHAKFVEVFNADLANGIGNCASRVANMIAKYFDGKLPLDAAAAIREAPPHELPFGTPVRPATLIGEALNRLNARLKALDWTGAAQLGVGLVGAIDAYINLTTPFKLAKVAESDAAKKRELACILAFCAEAVRVAALLLSPVMPRKMAQVLADWSSAPPSGVPLAELARMNGPHALKAGAPIRKGEILFQRVDVAEPPPGGGGAPSARA